MERLDGKIALITGASRGIGRAMALKFASLGASIALNYVRDDTAAQETLKQILQLGAEGALFKANVGDEKELSEMAQAVLARFGTLDILVHNAALGAFKPVHELRSNQWALSLDINARALLILAQKFLPAMEKKRAGNILAISSLGAHRYIPNYGAIGVSKAALETLVRYLAAEFAPKGIRVNCVSGGLVNTDALKAFGGSQNLKDEIVKRTPAGRIGEPEDLADVAAFLVSNEARWIYGQTVIADGGLSLL